MLRIQCLRMTVTLFAGVFFALPMISEPAQAQQAGGRMRVMVVNLTPEQGANDRFGRDLAREMRDRIDLPTHVAMSDDDIDDAAKEYDTRLRDLDCLSAQQLAGLIPDQVGMVLCGRYTQAGDNVQYSAEFVTIPGLETFPTEEQTVAERDVDTAADQIMDFFQATIDKVSQIAFCGMQFNSSNWEAAEEECATAVELAPESAEARSALARTYLEMERWQESLDQFHIILEGDPFDSAALQSAGYVASQLGNNEEARDYYARYLELNPENVAVRIRVARDLAEAGDDLGGMQLLEVGLDQDPSNVELHEQYGSMAARAALALQSEQPAPEAGQPRSLNPEVADLFRKAVESLEMVLDAKGQESLPQYVQSVMAAHIQLGEMEEAIALGRRGTQYFPRNAQVRSQLANAYNQDGQVDQAIATLHEALELDPELPNAYARIGQWLLAADRLDEAGDALSQAAERGEQPPDILAQMLFGYGFNTLAQENGDLAGAIEAYNLARELDISSGLRSQIDFFHGYALFQQGYAIGGGETQTLDTAQRSLPLFQEALEYINRGRAYGDSNPGSNIDGLIENANTLIEIQEAIIRRGR